MPVTTPRRLPFWYVLGVLTPLGPKMSGLFSYESPRAIVTPGTAVRSSPKMRCSRAKMHAKSTPASIARAHRRPKDPRTDPTRGPMTRRATGNAYQPMRASRAEAGIPAPFKIRSRSKSHAPAKTTSAVCAVLATRWRPGTRLRSTKAAAKSGIISTGKGNSLIRQPALGTAAARKAVAARKVVGATKVQIAMQTRAALPTPSAGARASGTPSRSPPAAANRIDGGRRVGMPTDDPSRATGRS